ncbi:HlyD family secretion protein [Caminibacter sp.]
MKKKIIIGLLILFLIGGIIALYRYINFNRHYASSNAVFVKSDTLTFLSFKLPGKIEKIYVSEGESVKKGELLAKLDTKDLQIQAKEVNFSINALNKEIKALKLQKEKLSRDIDLGLEENKNNSKKLQKEIEATAFDIDSIKPQLSKLKSDYEKFKRLYKEGKTSKERFEKVKVAYLSLKDKFNASQKRFEILLLKQNDLKIQKQKLLNSRLEVKRLSKLINAKNNQLKALKEKYALILQNIKDSFLYAPFNSQVAKKFVNSDEVVAAGQRVLSIVNLKDVYVLDLLEETKLKGIAPGCEATVHIDALGKDYKAKVTKILPASAATFALLPRDISSGEFTKLAQRFYVRLRFEKVPKGVKVGMSGEVTIKRCKMEN